MTELCRNCGENTLKLSVGPGRTKFYFDVILSLPDDFEMMQCTSCGATRVSTEQARELDRMLAAQSPQCEACNGSGFGSGPVGQCDSCRGHGKVYRDDEW